LVAEKRQRCLAGPSGVLPCASISGGPATTGNIAPRLSDSHLGDIEFPARAPQFGAMKRIIPFLVLATLALPATAQAACYADYKAKQDAPLRLHYGVAEIDTPCTADSARDQLQSRLERAGWTLLNVVSVFDESGLAERKESAGPNFLRY
jgi:hypothetical protein